MSVDNLNMINTTEDVTQPNYRFPEYQFRKRNFEYQPEGYESSGINAELSGGKTNTIYHVSNCRKRLVCFGTLDGVGI